VSIRYKTSTGVLAAAIAVPLVLTATLLLVTWFFKAEHKRRRNAEQLIQEWNNRGSGANAEGVLGLIHRPPELGGVARKGCLLDKRRKGNLYKDDKILFSINYN
jgi:hypothetical protein